MFVAYIIDGERKWLTGSNVLLRSDTCYFSRYENPLEFENIQELLKICDTFTNKEIHIVELKHYVTVNTIGK